MSTLFITSLTGISDEQLEAVARQYETTYLKILPFLLKHGISSQAMLIEVDVVEITLRAGTTDGAERKSESDTSTYKYLNFKHQYQKQSS